MKRVLFLLVFILPTITQAQKYFCISEQATGFKFMNGEWRTTNFTAGDKYIVDYRDRSVTLFGESARIHGRCSVMLNDLFDCTNDKEGRFTMKAKNLRYQRSVNISGYVWGDTYGTPFVEIGVCEKL